MFVEKDTRDFPLLLTGIFKLIEAVGVNQNEQSIERSKRKEELLCYGIHLNGGYC